MAIEQFIDGESLASVRTKINNNDAALDARLDVVEAAIVPLAGAYVKPLAGIPESDLATPLTAKINAAKALPGANTDITSLGGITGGVQEVDFVRFDLTPETTPTTPGTMYWDSAENAQTLSVVMSNTGTTLQVGQEQYQRVKASSTITNGQVVMYVGAQGNSGLMLASPAAGVLSNRPDIVLGVATEDIATNASGYITNFGIVRGINTTGVAQGESWLEGDLLYYNPSIVGGITKVRPTTPNPIVAIGNVISAATNGSIFVRLHHGSTFGYSDGNVQITSPQNNDFVVYDGSQQRWENYTAANARTALGLGTAATTASTSYATAAQGVKADTALQQATADTRYVRTVGGGWGLQSTPLTDPPVNCVFATSTTLQAEIDAAAARATVAKIAPGEFTDIGGGVYSAPLAVTPHEVFINQIRARKFTTLVGFTDGAFFEMKPAVTDVGWVYVPETSTIYVYAKGNAPVAVTAVRYQGVAIAGANSGPIYLRPGVWLTGASAASTAIINDGVFLPFNTTPESYTSSLHVAEYSRASDLSVITRNIRQPDYVPINTSIEGAAATSALLFPPRVMSDCFIGERLTVRVEGSPGTPIRNNTIEFAGSGNNEAARGVLLIDCDIEAPTYGYALETQTLGFVGWVRFVGGRVVGPLYIDGAQNTFEWDGTYISLMRADGSSCGTKNGLIVSASAMTKHPDRPYLNEFHGVNFVTSSSDFSIPFITDFNNGPVLLDGCNLGVQCGPVGVSNSTLTPAQLAQFYVRATDAPPFYATSLSPTLRCPMGLNVIVPNQNVSSTAGGTVLSGFQVSSDEITVAWAFEAEFSGTFAANANNKAVRLECGPVGSVATLLDTTALAFDNGTWVLRVVAERVYVAFSGVDYVHVKSYFTSSLATLTVKAAAITYASAPFARPALQFQVVGTGAANDVLLKHASVKSA